MIDENPLEGTARTIGGKVQGAVGDRTGDASTEVQGSIREAANKVQTMYGQAVDEVKRFAATKPVAALLSATGIAVAMGFLLRRRQ